MTVLAACHVHSDWSYDGKWPLDCLAHEFGTRGYRALLMTEHDRGFSPERLARYRAACAAVSSDRILVVPGIEYSDARNVVHILTWGALPFLGERRATTAILQEVAAASGVAVLAHPSRRNAWSVFDAAWSPFLLGAEVWNRKSDGWAPSRQGAELVNSNALVPFVGVDFHDRRQMFPLAMELETMLPATETSIIECLRQKRCRPTAFGRPLTQWTGGWMNHTLRSVECCRRVSAQTYRLCRRAAATLGA